MTTVKTTKIQGGADYAKVSDRLLTFREENPRASISTTPTVLESGMVMFKAYILKDKADVESADATAHALQVKAGTKDFEKLETVAVGRALALLGYGASGEVASAEEMEEFEAYKDSKKDEKIELAKEKLDATKNVEELRSVWVAIDGALKVELNDYKNNIKIKHESN